MEQVKKIDLTKSTRLKLKTIVICLANETELINNEDFFKKYQKELEKVGITSLKSSSSSLSSSIINGEFGIIEKNTEHKKTRYKLKSNWQDLTILEN